jgi:hypothetical protein
MIQSTKTPASSATQRYMHLSPAALDSAIRLRDPLAVTARANAEGTHSQISFDVPSGYLLFVRQRTLFAQAFDPLRLELIGNPFRVAAQVVSARAPALSVSATGTIVYRSGSVLSSRRPFVWFDRSGKEIGRVSESAGEGLSLSRDGSRVAFWGGPLPGPPEIWELTFDREGMTRVTTNGKANLDPVWAPDGSQIVFSASDPTGALDLYRMPMTGDGKEELLLLNDRGGSLPSDWSTDGRFLLYGSFDRTQTRGGENPSPSFKRLSRKRTRNSLPMASGSRTSRTRRAALRFTYSRSPSAPDAKSRSPLMAVRRCGGGATAENCSTSRWTAG